MVDLSRVEGGMGALFTLFEPPRLNGVAPEARGWHGPFAWSPAVTRPLLSFVSGSGPDAHNYKHPDTPPPPLLPLRTLPHPQGREGGGGGASCPTLRLGALDHEGRRTVGRRRLLPHRQHPALPSAQSTAEAGASDIGAPQSCL